MDAPWTTARQPGREPADGQAGHPEHERRDRDDHQREHHEVGAGRVAEDERLGALAERVEHRLGDGEGAGADQGGQAAELVPPRDARSGVRPAGAPAECNPEAPRDRIAHAEARGEFARRPGGTATSSPSDTAREAACPPSTRRPASAACRPTASSSTWWRPVPRTVRPSCSATASRSSPTRGATRSLPWPTPATTCSPRTSAATASPTVPSRSRPTTSTTSPTTCWGSSTTSAPSKAAFVGHDWGSMVVGQMALLHPDRMTGVVAMSVPLLPRGPDGAGAAHARRLRRELLLHPLLPGARRGRRRPRRRPRGDHDADARRPGRAQRRPGRPRRAQPTPTAAGSSTGSRSRTRCPTWLSQEELDHYIEVFSRTGFTGGINWYRNFDRNWETTAAARRACRSRSRRPSSPAARDPVNVMSPAAIMDGHALDHRGNTIVEGAGHWVQQEAPDEVNAALLTFLGSLDQGGR